MAKAIAARAVSKIYKTKKGDDKLALDSIDLTIEKGSFFGLLGPNGAGKSTFINILAGLVSKTSGKINICGHDIDKDIRSAKRSIGVVPQELILDPFFHIHEALENHAGYYGIKKKDRRTDEIIEAVGLSDKAYTPARRLSGGMKRRLLIAKALTHDPDVLILDEPTAGVDVELREQLWEYVRKLNKEQGKTIVLTTHYLEEAQELCDNIAVINHGQIIACDKTKSLINLIDRKKISITPEKKITKVPDKLKSFDVKIEDDGVINIHYKPSKIQISDVLDRISNSNIKIKDLSTEDADLEEVFRHLTNKVS